MRSLLAALPTLLLPVLAAAEEAPERNLLGKSEERSLAGQVVVRNQHRNAQPVRLFHPGDVLECDLVLLLGQHPRLALAEGHGPAAATATLHLAHEIDPDTDEQQNRERADQQLSDQALRLWLDGRKANVVLVQQTDERVVIGLGADGVISERLAAAKADLLTIDFHPLHLAGPHLVEEIRVIPQLRRGAAHAGQALHDREQDDDDDDKYKYVFGQIIHIRYLVGANPDTGFLDRF